jgi:hypothetical protein
MDQINNMEDFSYYDGEIVNEEIYDSDTIESRLSDVIEIKK